MHEQEKEAKTIPNEAGCRVQIGERDGSMIPRVRLDEEASDKRKNKRLSWKKVRLSLAHEQVSEGRTSPKFGAVFQGRVDEAGQNLLNTAILAGFGKQTH